MSEIPEGANSQKVQPKGIGAKIDIKYNPTEIALHQSIEYAPIGIVIFDREMRYLAVSRKWLEDYNLSKEIIGRSHYEVFPDIPPEWKQIHQQCLAGAIAQHDEDPFPRADGSVEWVSWSIRPWHLANGEIGGMTMFTQNITQRKQTEAALKESNILLRSILESTPDLIVVKDCKGIYFTLNSSSANFLGKTVEEVIGKDDTEVFPLEVASAIMAKDRQIIETGVGVTYEEELSNGKSQGTYLTSKAPWRDTHGNILGIIAITRNISNVYDELRLRKQTEEDLHKSNILLRSILESTPDFIVVKDCQGRHVALNSNLANFMGKPIEEIIGKDDTEVLPLDAALAIMAKDRQVIATGKLETYEEEVSSGNISGTFLTTKAPWRDTQGNILGIIATTRNISDRKQAELALQLSEERFRKLIEATSQIVWTTDAEGAFITDQPQWCAFTGQTFEEAKGWGWLNMIHPKSRESVAQKWTDALANRSFYEVETITRRYDGEYRCLMVRGVPILEADGSIREWVGANTDITEQRQADQKLRQTLEILDSASDSIIIRDMDDRIVYWNKGAEILYGWKRGEVIGQYIHTFLETVFPKPLETVLSEFLQQGHWGGELHHTTRDGRNIIVASRWTLQRDANGQPDNQLEINTDITERKQFEVALTKAKEAAETASHAKSEFLANMSHELRTPLNGILGYAQILQRSKHLGEDERSRIDVIYQCGSHLLTLINDILDLSKIEAQKVELMTSDFHFPAFLQGVAEMCRIRAELKGIQFRYQLANELPVGIRADEKRLRQVLINLLSNAIKFTDVGSVTFTISYASEGKIRFEVRDSGIGIPQEKLQAIFQPFEQAGDRRRQIEGTGLGLAISKRIVELMDSTIQVQSEIGVGSIFWFEVHLQEAEEWVKSSQADDYGQIIGIKDRRPKILVVDDKWENRSVINNLLTPIGFEVTEANDGEAGWQKILEFQPDLVLTDLLMPELDGFELIGRIRQSEAFKHIIIIVSSASVFESDQHRSIEAGGNDFLPKPVQAIALFQKLRHYLNLEWLYEERTTDNQLDQDHPELVLPPPAELKTLYEFVMKGNFKGIIKQAALISQIDPKYIPFAKQLHQLAKGFQDQEILALIHPHK
ncbi:PAS domain S-box protein [Nostoc sp. FACHB-152]|uniref:PAS domain S-box protein n=1 Tax=unclassified Nostoc TaxID=2593658 RepID=UPI001688A337|nr:MULTISPECIES: PAS domain S-box protein [unclassified Nostoc]MBD2449595.1 PAS domain S-box protein [Nostoc sp. FACHB-152]MBD2468962.1 PAS domain S-box protein [Nostoc sp. FACHB-145]